MTPIHLLRQCCWVSHYRDDVRCPRQPKLLMRNLKNAAMTNQGSCSGLSSLHHELKSKPCVNLYCTLTSWGQFQVFFLNRAFKAHPFFKLHADAHANYKSMVGNNTLKVKGAALHSVCLTTYVISNVWRDTMSLPMHSSSHLCAVVHLCPV